MARHEFKLGSHENSLLADTSTQIHDLSRRLEPPNPECVRIFARHVVGDLMSHGWQDDMAFYQVASGLVTDLFVYARLLERRPTPKCLV